MLKKLNKKNKYYMIQFILYILISWKGQTTVFDRIQNGDYLWWGTDCIMLQGKFLENWKYPVAWNA